jgi:hypothetical protein
MMRKKLLLIALLITPIISWAIEANQVAGKNKPNKRPLLWCDVESSRIAGPTLNTHCDDGRSGFLDMAKTQIIYSGVREWGRSATKGFAYPLNIPLSEIDRYFNYKFANHPILDDKRKDLVNFIEKRSGKKVRDEAFFYLSSIAVDTNTPVYSDEMLTIAAPVQKDWIYTAPKGPLVEIHESFYSWSRIPELNPSRHRSSDDENSLEALLIKLENKGVIYLQGFQKNGKRYDVIITPSELFVHTHDGKPEYILEFLLNGQKAYSVGDYSIQAQAAMQDVNFYWDRNSVEESAAGRRRSITTLRTAGPAEREIAFEATSRALLDLSRRYRWLFDADPRFRTKEFIAVASEAALRSKNLKLTQAKEDQEFDFFTKYVTETSGLESIDSYELQQP